MIGGALAGLRNIIGGNGQSGIGIYSGAAGTDIRGNTIGFSAPLVFLGNGWTASGSGAASTRPSAARQPARAT